MHRADWNGVEDAGRTYVLFGRDTSVVGNFSAAFSVATLLPPGGGDGTQGFVLPGFADGG